MHTFNLNRISIGNLNATCKTFVN